MAENQDGQEKSEEATSKRVQDARKKGQVPRSRELNTFVMMLASSGALVMFGEQMMQGIAAIFREGFSISREDIFDPQSLIALFKQGIFDGLLVAAPLFLVTVVVAIVSSLLIGGWNFSIQAMAFKGSKMNPLKGLKRIFGPKGLVELLKALGKVTVVGVMAVWMLMWQADYLMLMGRQALEPALVNMGSQLGLYFLALSASLVIIAIADAPFQIWDNKRQLKMTKQEVKDEFKQTEGAPEIRQRVRAAQREMAQRRMMENVPQADVVITNPTHYAVALKYDQNKMGAPVVVAKGADLVAGRIREIAFEHNVPVIESPPLARAIYFHTEIEQQIPQGLYVAVAKVLAYVFGLRTKPGTDFSRTMKFEDVTIPEDLRRDT